MIPLFLTVLVLKNLRNLGGGSRQQPAGVLILDCRHAEWYGRNGNNMLSIFHAALFAYSKGWKFVIAECRNDFLELSHLENFIENQEPKGNVTATNQFITPADGFSMYINSSTTEHVPLRIQHKLPDGAGCHRIPILSPMVEHLAVSNTFFTDDLNLVISIRSGDVFLKHRPPPSIYTPPPLSFYVDIITYAHPSGELIIVSEKENLSPIAQKLLELYPERARLQTGTLEEDAMVILGAKNLVMTSSTFAWALGMASKKLERLYSFDNQLQTLDIHALSGVHVEEYYPDDYLKAWKNTPEQLEYLFDFPVSKLKKRILDIPKC